MRPVAAWAVVAGLVAVAVAAFTASWPVAAGLALLSLLAARQRLGLLGFAALTLVLHAALVGFLRPTGPDLAVGVVRFGLDGAWLGVVAGLRLVAVFGANVAVLGRVAPARLLDGLRLPVRWTAFVAAVLIAGQDLGRDFAALRDARRSRGDWPDGRVGRLLAAVGFLPALMVHAVRRAEVRRDALWLAGVATGPRFAPVVAVTALAAAGRLALVGLPNVALTYVVVFLGGLVFGGRVGFWAGFWAMALTDLLLSGLVPSAFVNAPAMGLLGLAGGLLRGVDLSGDAGRPSDRAAGRLFAAAVGFAGTLLFSAASDATTWLLVPEFRGGVDVLVALVLAGAAFNVVPAATNAVLFWLAVVPVHAAFRALDEGGRGGCDGRDGRDGMPAA